MSELRRRIEAWFEALADWIFRRRWLALGLMLILVVLLASQIPKLTIDTSNEGFLHPDDPILTAYNQFRDQFGRDEMIIIAVQPPKVFDLDFLRKLKSLHEDLEDNVPHLDDLTSMVNARSTRGEEDRLIVEDLLEKFPEDEAGLAALEERVMSNPLYLNRLISEDGTVTTLALKTDTYSSLGLGGDALAGFGDDKDRVGGEEALSGFGEEGEPDKRVYLTDRENSEVIRAVARITDKYRAEDFRIDVAGSPIITHWIKRSMIRDMRLFMLLALSAIALCLFIMYRRLSGVILPLLTVALALISTLGLMGLFGTAIKTPTMILPSFLLAVGVGAAVHVLALFYQDFQKSGDKRAAIVYALGHSGLAIVMTALTTAAGLGSFATAEVAPIADLGRFAGFGVLLALVYTIILLPALLAIFPLKAKAAGRITTVHFDRILDRVADFSVKRAGLVVTVGFILIALSLAGAAQTRFSHDVLRWLPNGLPARQATEKIDERLKGSVVIEVMVDTGRENGLYDPVVLNKLDRLARELEKLDWGEVYVGKATSVADMLKEIHQALNGNDPGFYVIPDNEALIPQEFLLFENSGSDDLEDVVDSGFRRARFTIKMPFVDAYKSVPLIAEVESRFKEAFAGRAEITVTGLVSLFARTIHAAIASAARSYIIAFVVVTVMMILLIGSLKLGLISMIPNLTPILMILGIMIWFNVPVDMFTMLIGSIAIGLAVDDTIHFMHHFRRYYDETGEVAEAVRQTLHTAGRAMLVYSVVLAIGFFILMLASMNNIIRFGFLTGVTVILALLADFFMAPALMALIHKKKHLPQEAKDAV